MKILTELPVKVLYFYADYFLLITNIVFVSALLEKVLKKEKKKIIKKKSLWDQ